MDIVFVYSLDNSLQTGYGHSEIFEYNLRRLILYNLKVKHKISFEERMKKLEILDELETKINFNSRNELVDKLADVSKSDFWKDDIKRRIDSLNQEEQYILNFALNYMKRNIEDDKNTIFFQFNLPYHKENEKWNNRCEKYYNIKLRKNNKIKLKSSRIMRNMNTGVKSDMIEYDLWLFIDILAKIGVAYYIDWVTAKGYSNIMYAILNYPFSYILSLNFKEIEDIEKIKIGPKLESIKIEEELSIDNDSEEEDIKTSKIRNGLDNVNEKIELVDIQIEILSVMRDLDTTKLFLIPECVGTYLFIIESGEIYIGSSANVYKRLVQHKTKYQIKNINIYQTRNTMDAKILEYYLIRKFNPSLNKEYNVEQ